MRRSKPRPKPEQYKRNQIAILRASIAQNIAVFHLRWRRDCKCISILVNIKNRCGCGKMGHKKRENDFYKSNGKRRIEIALVLIAVGLHACDHWFGLILRHLPHTQHTDFHKPPRDFFGAAQPIIQPDDVNAVFGVPPCRPMGIAVHLLTTCKWPSRLTVSPNCDSDYIISFQSAAFYCHYSPQWIFHFDSWRSPLSLSVVIIIIIPSSLVVSRQKFLFMFCTKNIKKLWK